VVRSFISVPAGIAEMSRARFIILSAIGSALWVAILGSLGDAAGSNWNHVSKDFHAAQWPVLIAIVLVIGYGLWHRIRSVRRQNTN
jgi:membrane protein DedA with SNARE-associated domain